MKIIQILFCSAILAGCKTAVTYEVTHEKCEGIVLREEFPIPEYGYEHPRSIKYAFTSIVTIPYYEITDLYTHCDSSLCKKVKPESKVWVYARVIHKVKTRKSSVDSKVCAMKTGSFVTAPPFRIYSDTATLVGKRHYVARSLLKSNEK
jgi:hypothetical protein